MARRRRAREDHYLHEVDVASVQRLQQPTSQALFPGPTAQSGSALPASCSHIPHVTQCLTVVTQLLKHPVSPPPHSCHPTPQTARVTQHLTVSPNTSHTSCHPTPHTPHVTQHPTPHSLHKHAPPPARPVATHHGRQSMFLREERHVVKGEE